MQKTLGLFLLLSILLSTCSEQETTPITLNSNALSLKVGDMSTLEVSGNTGAVEWLNSNDSVASVYYGVVTAKAIGKTIITAKCGKSKATCEVFVTGTDGASLRISPAMVSMKKGETYQFQYGNTYDLDLTWTSSDETIARVDNNGQVIALAPGNATITLATNIESVSALVAVEHEWGEYQLVWSDEFNGTSLDESNWTIENRGNWHNNELQYYTNRSENIRVQNGCLEIQARKETYDNREYTSARIKSQGKQAFSYGKIESRISFPGGQGTWPAFWMLGNTGNWPACGEIDIIEHIGAQPRRASFAVHTTMKNGDNGKNWSNTHFFDYSLAGEFHTYGIEWCKEEENGKDCIRFMVDDVVYATIWEEQIDSKQYWPFNSDQYIIFNLAIGGTMGGTVDDSIFNNDVIMYVDWVRVYQREEK